MKFIKKEWGEASYRKLHLQKGLGIMGMVLAFLFAENIYAQDSQTIKGMVRDVTGEPLIGYYRCGRKLHLESSRRCNTLHCLYGLCHP